MNARDIVRASPLETDIHAGDLLRGIGGDGVYVTGLDSFNVPYNQRLSHCTVETRTRLETCTRYVYKRHLGTVYSIKTVGMGMSTRTPVRTSRTRNLPT